MTTSLGALGDLHLQLERAATDSTLTPPEREARLTHLRGQINSLLGQADAYLADVKLVEQAQQQERIEALLAVREAADVRTELLRRDMATLQEVEDAGLPSHEQLDQFGEEGLLMEFSMHWREALHPRDRMGRWRDVFKSVTPKSREGRKGPSVLSTPHRREPRMDVTPKELGIPEPEVPRPPAHAHKDEALMPEERAQADMERLQNMTEEERISFYKERASVFDRKVSSLASLRLAAALSSLGGRQDPGTSVVHPEDVDKFLEGAPYGKVLYHGTPRQNIESIFRYGLRGGSEHMDIKGRETVFLVSSPEMAKAHGTPVAVATKLDNPIILEHGENANDAMKRLNVSNLDSFDGMVRKMADGNEIVTAWEPKDDLKVVTDEPVIDPRELDNAELKFNAAGSVNQHTLGEYAREAAGEPDTVDLHSTTDAEGNRVYSAERQKLHQKIIDTYLRQRRRVENPDRSNPFVQDVGQDWEFCPDCPELTGNKDPFVLFSGGGYAAGKGGVVKSIIDSLRSGYDGPALVLDPDEIKAMLPEFQERYNLDPLANAVTYREAWDISQAIMREAQNRNLDMVVDGISNTSPEEMIRRIKSFTDNGYKAKVNYVDIPTEEAIRRSGDRAATSTLPKDRRHIPEMILRAVHRDVAATIPALARRVEKEGIPVDISVYDNDQPVPEGKKFGVPKLFFSYLYQERQSQIHDEALWERLRKKGKERLKEEGIKVE